MLKQPWPPLRLLPHLTLTLLSSILLLLPHRSFSQSDSPQNIETFFPNETLTATPPSPIPLPQQNPPSPPSSDREKITRAILITAASTLLVAAVFFLFVHLYTVRRRRLRDRVVNVGNTLPPAPPLAEAALAREGFTRFGGNVKGLILDENGLDVLYWRKTQSQRDNKMGSFRKETVHCGDGDEEKNVIYSKNKEKSETPLLRGRSSTSHSVVHNDNPPPPPPVKSDSFEFAKPDPPPPVKKTVPAPPPPPLKKTAALSKPPPAPRGSSSSGEGSSSENGQVKLKPLHWDKVNPDSDHSMVWDKIDRGSFR